MNSDIKINREKTWFVTGASKGLGLVLVQDLLMLGYTVAATSRSKEQLNKAVGPDSDRFISIQMDLASEDSVKKAISESLGKFSKIDVVVNNAGYSLSGALEENSDKEVRENFDINVFGLLNVLRNVSPVLRNQKSGCVINISSLIGIIGCFPGFSTYAGTKFAVDGLTEVYKEEMKPFGVKVVTLNPGYVRTEFLSTGSLQVSNRLPEYSDVHKFIDVNRKALNGTQRGDPHKFVEIMVRIAETDLDATHIVAGAETYAVVDQKIETMKKDMDTWKQYALATDFDNIKQ